MKKNIYIIIGIFATLAIGVLLGNFLNARGDLRKNSISSFLQNHGSKIDNLLSLINSQYVDTVDVDSLSEDAIVNIVSNLDPHSVYIPSKDLEAVNSELESSFSGIGVQFVVQNDTVLVVAVVNGGPSEKAGLMPGDQIVKVNDTLFVGKSLVSNDKVIKKLRGREGTQVKLGIKRNGTKELLSYEITRGEIPLTSVYSKNMLTSDIGIIGVDKFAQNTYNEFLHAISELRAKGAKKFIIDLRGNSGGLLDQAVQMINEFLPDNEMIVYAQGKSYPRMDFKSDGTGTLKSNSVVVLIDEFSASASEIFAGAIQDNDRGTIIGRRSFGKGLVQQQFPLSDGSALRLTVARYYTPSGRSIQKPYVKGDAEDYEKDIIDRYRHGEFDNRDSIHQKKSQAYKTLKGRTVYSGGGIMPDIFVPRDTSDYSLYLNKLFNKRLFLKFALQYTDKNKAILSKYKDWKSMDSYLSTQNLLPQFTEYSRKYGVNPNAKDINISKAYIDNQINANIVRNKLNDYAFYAVLYKRDKTVIKALDVLSKQK